MTDQCHIQTFPLIDGNFVKWNSNCCFRCSQKQRRPRGKNITYAWFDFIKSASSPLKGSGLKEKPLYKQSEMKKIGPIKVRSNVEAKEFDPCLNTFEPPPPPHPTHTHTQTCIPILHSMLVYHKPSARFNSQPCIPSVCPNMSALHFLMLPVKSLQVSPMGLGTWAWGNQLLWGYDESMDPELQQMFNLVVSQGINLFDTADSYGRLNMDLYIR